MLIVISGEDEEGVESAMVVESSRVRLTSNDASIKRMRCSAKLTQLYSFISLSWYMN